MLNKSQQFFICTAELIGKDASERQGRSWCDHGPEPIWCRAHIRLGNRPMICTDRTLGVGTTQGLLQLRSLHDEDLKRLQAFFEGMNQLYLSVQRNSSRAHLSSEKRIGEGSFPQEKEPYAHAKLKTGWPFSCDIGLYHFETALMT